MRGGTLSNTLSQNYPINNFIFGEDPFHGYVYQNLCKGGGGPEMRNLKNLNIIINTNSLRFIGIEVEFQKLNNIFKYYWTSEIPHKILGGGSIWRRACKANYCRFFAFGGRGVRSRHPPDIIVIESRYVSILFFLDMTSMASHILLPTGK